MNDYRNRQLALMLAPARERLMGRDISELCANAGADFDEAAQCIRLPSLGELVCVHVPDFVIAQELDMWRHLTLLQYLDTADGTPLSGREIALSELRGGLSRGLGFDKDIALIFSRAFRDAAAEDFARACTALGGTLVPGKADVSAEIPYAPRFPVTVHFWCGDEEFPPSGKTLVDANCEHYLTLEAAGGACSAVAQALANAHAAIRSE